MSSSNAPPIDRMDWEIYIHAWCTGCAAVAEGWPPTLTHKPTCYYRGKGLSAGWLGIRTAGEDDLSVAEQQEIRAWVSKMLTHDREVEDALCDALLADGTEDPAMVTRSEADRDGVRSTARGVLQRLHWAGYEVHRPEVPR